MTATDPRKPAWSQSTPPRRKSAATRARARRRRRAVFLAFIAALALAGGLVLGAKHHRTRAPVAAASAIAKTIYRAPLRHRPAVIASDSEAIETPVLARLIALGKPIYCAGRRGDEVALTFDDGPGPYTRLAIAKLRKHDIRATFFIVGRNIPLVAGALRAERALGAVGDHTFTHPLLTALAPSEAQAQIVRTKHDVEAASGGPVFLFRPPYGAHNSTIDAIARAHNLLEILWTVDSRDSLGANYAQIERNVIEGMHPGSIILMHENHGQTIRAMLSIFAALRRKHLRPVSVPRLLTDDPPSEAQLRAGGLGCGAGSSAGMGGG